MNNFSQIKISDIEGVFSKGINCGIKQSKLDLAYISVPSAAASAGVFTTNKFCAACVEHNRRVLSSDGFFKLLVVNSGNANAVTGKPGKENVQRTAELAAEAFGCQPSEVAIASTGIIGVQLPMGKVEQGILSLSADKEARDADSAAKAIMTTDLVPKHAGLEDTSFKIAGIAKGSGMIAPNMATMLAFLVTDADLSNPELQDSLTIAVNKSFNMMSVDNDTSTSDMVLLMSTGKSKIDDTEAFTRSLTEVCIDLAKQIAKDGEGAEKLLEVEVCEAENESAARAIAKSIINSPLVKTAVHGADPNWGRVIMAVGKTPDVNVDPERCSLYFQDICVLENGLPIEFDRKALCEKLQEQQVNVKVILGSGKGHAKAWGCDLTKGYIDINVEYN